MDPDFRHDETLEDQFDRVSRDPLAWSCPACAALPHQPCTAPTIAGRRPVRWVHSSRVDLAQGWA